MKAHAYPKLLTAIGVLGLTALFGFSVQATDSTQLMEYQPGNGITAHQNSNPAGNAASDRQKNLMDLLGSPSDKGASRAAVCGDSEPDDGEACDDGNSVGGDGCSADCTTIEDNWDCTQAIAGSSNLNILVDGSFEDLNAGGEWTSLGHSLFGPDVILDDNGFGAPFAAGPDGNTISGNYFLIAGGAFSGPSTGNATHEAVAIPAEATTLEFQWATLASGPAGDPCADATDGLTLTMTKGATTTEVWSSLDAGPCTNQNPYARVIIDLATAPGGPYNGETVSFEFTASATGIPPAVDLTNIMLDDVSINIPADPVIPPVASSCLLAVCGDGIFGGNEECDDGNTTDGDGCSAVCEVEQPNFVCTDPSASSFDVLASANGDAIREGSLEDGRGRFTGEWEESRVNDDDLLPICTEVFCPFLSANFTSDGIFYALFGADDTPSDTQIAQTTVIPADASVLTFDMLVASPADPGPCDSTDDFLEVTIDGSVVYTYDCTFAVTNYTEQSADISAFADGLDHEVIIRGVTFSTNGENTNIFVDNIQIPLTTPIVGIPSECTELQAACDTIETFDAGIPAGWTVVNLGPDATDGWGQTGDGTCLGQNAAGLDGIAGPGLNLTLGDTGAACADSDATGQVDIDAGGTAQEMNTYLCSPQLDLSLVTAPVYAFRVNYQSANNEFDDAGTPDDFTDDFDDDLLEVLVGTNAPNALTVPNYTRIGGVNDHEDGDIILTFAQELRANLEGSELEGAAEGWVCFHYQATYGWFAQIDNAGLRGDDCNLAPADTDGDGVFDSTDNCTNLSNPDQTDSNGDGIGNACDQDVDNNCVINFFDVFAFQSTFNTTTGDPGFNPDMDHRGGAPGSAPDGNINFFDYFDYSNRFLQPPGPSANECVPAT